MKEELYRSAARAALKLGVNIRSVERNLRRLGASRTLAKRVISEVKRGV